MKRASPAPQLLMRERDFGDKPLKLAVEEAERQHILSVLERAQGKRGRAAQILGISRKTLWKKLKQLGIDVPRFMLPDGNT
ncbi:MAG: hypothetical protein HY695_16145 [Deltaproteobacteria bacterium]|nr:hypothetical protein [Deltaproteobacteria bacterium]